MTIKSINLLEQFKSFTSHWDPKIIAELNGQYVKIARFKGAFTKHMHEDEDELFYVLEGEIELELEGETIVVKSGECAVIPKGVYHKPIAQKEAKVMLFEPKTTLNTGNVKNSFTVDKPQKLK